MTDVITPKANSVENMVRRAIYKVQESCRPVFRRLLLFCAVLMSAIMLTACQPKNPEMVSGLSAELLNYSQDDIYFIKINGDALGVHWAEAAKVGGVMGGGSSCCSGKISSIKPTANVTLKTNHGTYTTQAEVELPFPDTMNTLVVHVLPGRKVVLEVAPGPSRPRQDLMDKQIKALGLTKEEMDSSYMRDERPKYTGYYKPN